MSQSISLCLINNVSRSCSTVVMATDGYQGLVPVKRDMIHLWPRNARFKKPRSLKNLTRRDFWEGGGFGFYFNALMNKVLIYVKEYYYIFSQLVAKETTIGVSFMDRLLKIGLPTKPGGFFEYVPRHLNPEGMACGQKPIQCFFSQSSAKQQALTIYSTTTHFSLWLPFSQLCRFCFR